MSMAHVPREMHLLAGLRTECISLVVDQKGFMKSFEGLTEHFLYSLNVHIPENGR